MVVQLFTTYVFRCITPIPVCPQVEPPCFLAPEPDGVRLITPTSHALLQRVSESLLQVLSPGSTAPGALLLDAHKLFDAHSHKADEVLRSISGQLPEAVHACADAALASQPPITQTALLKVGFMDCSMGCGMKYSKT